MFCCIQSGHSGQCKKHYSRHSFLYLFKIAFTKCTVCYAFTAAKPHKHILPSPDRLCCSGAGDRRCRSLPGTRMDSGSRGVPDQWRYIGRFLSQNESTHSLHCADHRGRLHKCASRRLEEVYPYRLLNVIFSLLLYNSDSRQSIPLPLEDHSLDGMGLSQFQQDE